MAIWCAAWARSRGVAPPVRWGSAFRIEVNAPDQKERFVFPRLDAGEITRLASAIEAPGVFIKVCADEQRLAGLLPHPWGTSGGRCFMGASGLQAPEEPVPAGYTLAQSEDSTGLQLTILDGGGGVAGRGGLLVESGFAVLDRVVTEPDHRRKGIARAIVARLQREATRRGARGGLLVATAAGRRLYDRFGWGVMSDYTTAVRRG